MTGFNRDSSVAHGHEQAEVRGFARSAAARHKLASAAKVGTIGALLLALAACASAPASGGSPHPGHHRRRDTHSDGCWDGLPRVREPGAMG